MGCITSKSSAVDDSREGLTNDLTSSSKRTSEMKVSRLNTKKRVEGVWKKDKSFDGVESIDMKVSLIDKEGNGSVWLCDDQNGKKKMEKPELTVIDYLGLGRLPKNSEGEQVAAGWPSWLSSIAGEAIRGWIPRSANSFERFDKVSYRLVLSVYGCIIVQFNLLCY